MPFQKGNKLQPKKHSEETRRKISEAMKGKPSWNKGKKCPQLSGRNNGRWSEDASYHAIHFWLQRLYGKADKCENEGCTGKSNSYEWALKSGLEYERKRESFIQLCKSCHRKYDLTEEELRFMKHRDRDGNGRFV